MLSRPSSGICVVIPLVILTGHIRARASPRPAPAPDGGRAIPGRQPPVDIADFYAALVAAGQVDPAFEKRGGVWSYSAAIDEGEVTAKSPPIVDLRNGFMRGEYDQGPIAGVTLELALFNTAGDTKLILVSWSGSGDQGLTTSLKGYRFSGNQFREVSNELGALSGLRPRDFLDETYVANQFSAERQAFLKLQSDPQTKLEPEDVLLLEFHLPRQGTTVMATVVPCDQPPPLTEGPQLLDRANAILKKHRKYERIELTWSKSDASFKRGSAH